MRANTYKQFAGHHKRGAMVSRTGCSVPANPEKEAGQIRVAVQPSPGRVCGRDTFGQRRHDALDVIKPASRLKPETDIAGMSPARCLLAFTGTLSRGGTSLTDSLGSQLSAMGACRVFSKHIGKRRILASGRFWVSAPGDCLQKRFASGLRAIASPSKNARNGGLNA